MRDNNQDESDGLEEDLQNLDRFDDICSDDDLQSIEKLIGYVFNDVGPELELPLVWHGKYRLIRYLGGGMSNVYLAEQINLDDREVVVKVLPAVTAAKNEQRRDLFREESRTLAKANRQDAANMVFPIDYDVFEDHPYLVMEYVAGETLADHARSSELSIGDVVQLVTAAAQKLADAHRLEIVHGDIKPTNMMVRPDQSVQLIDFGLSAFFKNSQRTKFGGTRRYAAPEQLAGGKVDSLSDLYSLGVVFKELLEELPAENRTVKCRNLARQADQLANEMTEDTREQRPSSAEEVLHRLDQMTKRTNQNRFRGIALTTGLLALLFGVIWIWNPFFATDERQSAVIEWVESVNGKCRVDESGIVREVDLNNCWIENSSVEQLNVFEQLNHAMFANSNVDADGVKLLNQPLTTLVLAGTETDDRIFPVLEKFKVITLDLSGTRITGEGLKELPNPGRIDSLGVADMPIKDEDARAIAGMRRLRLLNLRGTQITAVGLRELAGLELEQIDLGNCPIEDDAISELAGIESLQRIVLSDCQGLTENCIDALLRMKNLTSIQIDNCKIGDEQILRLKALPKLSHVGVGAQPNRDPEWLRKGFGSGIKID